MEISRVHPSPSVKCLHDPSNLFVKPCLRLLVFEENQLVEVFARFMDNSYSAILVDHTLHLRQREIPAQTQLLRPKRKDTISRQ